MVNFFASCHALFALMIIISCLSVEFIKVGEFVSVIDMPPGEETIWWRGKKGFEVRPAEIADYSKEALQTYSTWSTINRLINK